MRRLVWSCGRIYVQGTRWPEEKKQHKEKDLSFKIDALQTFKNIQTVHILDDLFQSISFPPKVYSTFILV